MLSGHTLPVLCQHTFLNPPYQISRDPFIKVVHSHVTKGHQVQIQKWDKGEKCGWMERFYPLQFRFIKGNQELHYGWIIHESIQKLFIRVLHVSTQTSLGFLHVHVSMLGRGDFHALLLQSLHVSQSRCIFLSFKAVFCSGEIDLSAKNPG